MGRRSQQGADTRTATPPAQAAEALPREDSTTVELSTKTNVYVEPTSESSTVANTELAILRKRSIVVSNRRYVYIESREAMALIGYQRVSTDRQNTEAQQRALEERGCDRIFTDHAVSGATSSRPELDRMLDHLRDGDTLVVWKLDRLGRNTQHLMQVLKELSDRGVNFKSIQDGLEIKHNGTAQEKLMSSLISSLLSHIAEFERDMISERTRAGLETARQHGRVGGRKPVTADSREVRDVVRDREDGLSVNQIAEARGLGKSTVYKYLKIHEEAQHAAP